MISASDADTTVVVGAAVVGGAVVAGGADDGDGHWTVSTTEFADNTDHDTSRCGTPAERNEPAHDVSIHSRVPFSTNQ